MPSLPIPRIDLTLSLLCGIRILDRSHLHGQHDLCTRGVPAQVSLVVARRRLTRNLELTIATSKVEISSRPPCATTKSLISAVAFVWSGLEILGAASSHSTAVNRPRAAQPPQATAQGFWFGVQTSAVAALSTNTLRPRHQRALPTTRLGHAG